MSLAERTNVDCRDEGTDKVRQNIRRLQWHFFVPVRKSLWNGSCIRVSNSNCRTCVQVCFKIVNTAINSILHSIYVYIIHIGTWVLCSIQIADSVCRNFNAMQIEIIIFFYYFAGNRIYEYVCTLHVSLARTRNIFGWKWFNRFLLDYHILEDCQIVLVLRAYVALHVISTHFTKTHFCIWM